MEHDLNEHLLDLDELRQLLNLKSKDATRKLVAKQSGLRRCVIKLGRRVRFDPALIRQWLEGLKQSGNGEAKP